MIISISIFHKKKKYKKLHFYYDFTFITNNNRKTALI